MVKKIFIPFRGLIEEEAEKMIDQWAESPTSGKRFSEFSALETHLAAMNLSAAISMKRLADAINRMAEHELGPVHTGGLGEERDINDPEVQAALERQHAREGKKETEHEEASGEQNETESTEQSPREVG